MECPMLRPAFLPLSFLFWTSTAFGQATTTEPQAIQALLAEVHQLRQDLQAAANGARRAQILIYRLYVQEAAVARASQRLDEAKVELGQLQARKRYTAVEIKNYEERRDGVENAVERKRLEDAINNLQSQMEALAPEEQEAQTKKTEREEQSRIEQAKLDQLQAELDQIDRTLMTAANRQESGQRSHTGAFKTKSASVTIAEPDNISLDLTLIQTQSESKTKP
jgi:chromosome segregation ATPase